MKFGLRNIRLLLQSAGNPHRLFPSIHIAGTNGKGSTASFIASILFESGFRTGLYTSPHLVRFTERIRIDGREMDEMRLVHYVDRLRPMIDLLQATFFEATTCVAFQYFADEKVDVAVVEAGLGGRLDSTNVLRPLASVITNVSFDHMEYLGNTLRKIAAEKGGIIKRGIPCIVGKVEPEAAATLQRIARRKHATLIRAYNRLHGATATDRWEFPLRDVPLGLPGKHQHENATTAVTALTVLRRKNRMFRSVSANTIRRGLAQVCANTGLRGRLERVGKRLLLDVAHNADGMMSLVSSLQESGNSNFVVVFGVLKDKDVDKMVELLRPLARSIVAVRPDTKRAVTASQIVKAARNFGILVTNGGSVRRGLLKAFKLAGARGGVLVTGSHYVVGEALAAIENKRFPASA